MKPITIIFFTAFCLLTLAAAGQVEENDPYSVELVRIALKRRVEGTVNAKTQTNLARMGDAVSIALLKDLRDDELSDPRTVAAFLPIVRDAFSEPRFITFRTDRQPKVTVFFLKQVEQGVEDPRLREKIEETIQFVKAKATE